MKTFLLPYNQGSAGCKALAEAAGALRIRLNNSRFRAGYNKLVINWGNSRTDVCNPNWLNSPDAVARASNKLDALSIMREHGVPTPEFTWDIDTALVWLKEGSTVVCRTKLNGHSGEGIVIATKCDGLVNAQLYTKYFKAFDEYRVHVFDGKVIDIQQKKKRDDVPKDEANFMVRSHANGFNFCRDGVELPDACADAAIAAIEALGLDFGAVDLRYNSHHQKPCVLEVNTAPGLEGTTLEKYCSAVAELISKLSV